MNDDEGDRWELGRNTVTRIHNMPRKNFFSADEFYSAGPCPVHVKRLSLECTAEMNYEEHVQGIHYETLLDGEDCFSFSPNGQKRVVNEPGAKEPAAFCPPSGSPSPG